MQMLKNLLAIILAFSMLFMTSCGKNKDDDKTIENSPNTDTPTITEQQIQLSYCSNDTINPYKTINKSNSELGKLLYEPLVICSNEFEPINILAENVVTDGITCTVTLKSANFSDGSEITADDVLNSYNLAKNSTAYASLLYEVRSIRAEGSKTIVFELTKNDPYFANLLMFPILKKGTESLKNEDNVEIKPIGSGKFVFSEDGKSLISNSKYYGELPSITKINLVDAPDTESVSHYVEIGAVDLYYTDPADNNIVRMSGKKASVNMPNLVYVGINQNYVPLKSIELRHAISSSIDRDAINETAFFGNATSATGFFHPVFKETDGYQTIQPKAQTKIAIENLEKIGYNNLDTDEYRISSANKRLSLTLLVNKDNSFHLEAGNLVKKQLAESGVEIIVNPVSSEVYSSALKNGHFQLFIGEIRLTPNMDISPLVSVGGSAAYGISEEMTTETSESADNYLTVLIDYSAGKTSISSIATSLLTFMPAIPLVYRNSLIFYSNSISDIGSASMYDIFLSINNFKN